MRHPTGCVPRMTLLCLSLLHAINFVSSPQLERQQRPSASQIRANRKAVAVFRVGCPRWKHRSCSANLVNDGTWALRSSKGSRAQTQSPRSRRVFLSCTSTSLRNTTTRSSTSLKTITTYLATDTPSKHEGITLSSRRRRRCCARTSQPPAVRADLRQQHASNCCLSIRL